MIGNSTLSKIAFNPKASFSSNSIFWGFSLISLLSIFSVIIFESWFFLLAPVALIAIFIGITDYKFFFYFLLLCLPMSGEFRFGSLGTDLPSEPLIVGIMLLYGLDLLSKGKKTSTHFLMHPISLLILLHLGWIFVTSIVSNNPVVSMKFFLAKTWYIVVFYFFAATILRKNKDHKRFFFLILVPLVVAILVTMYRQSLDNFDFEKVEKAMKPFFRNHVNYAAIMAVFSPFIWYAKDWFKKWSIPWFMILACLGLFLLGIYFSYTRAAYVTVIMAAGASWVIRWKLVKPILFAVGLGAILGLGYLYQNSTYLDYAPDYNKTISHRDFDDLLEATYKMEDISTMERLYRWVAGANMAGTEYIAGFGPGNFYNYYKTYTVYRFATYVSDNEDMSGPHCYYLMVMVDQGILGFLIFIVLTFYVLIRGEVIYHRLKDPKLKNMAMAAILSLIVIDAFLLINDLIETDKIGSFYFMNIAMLVNLDFHSGGITAKKEDNGKA